MTTVTKLQVEIISDLTTQGWESDQIADGLQLNERAVIGVINNFEYKMRCEREEWIREYGWTWVLDNGELICSGACDPGDEEIFEEYFGFEKENKPMTNAEFLNKLNAMFAEIFPKAKGKRTVNELIFALRQDNEIEDYCLNINSKSNGFSFGFAKQSFFPTRSLTLKIDSIEYSEDEDSEYPCIVVKTN
jgi:hypothetical protein